MSEHPKRSSLKTSNPLNIDDIMKYKKRNSVSWNMGSKTFNFEKLKTNFEKIDENRKEKKEKFAEKRRQSIKNEFTLVKEMMKNKIDEIEDDDEIKINTEKNSKLNEKETDSESEKI